MMKIRISKKFISLLLLGLSLWVIIFCCFFIFKHFFIKSNPLVPASDQTAPSDTSSLKENTNLTRDPGENVSTEQEFIEIGTVDTNYFYISVLEDPELDTLIIKARSDWFKFKPEDVYNWEMQFDTTGYIVKIILYIKKQRPNNESKY